MIVKLLTEHYLEYLSLKVGCTGSSESTLIKMPHCWNHMSWLIFFICCSIVVMYCLFQSTESLHGHAMESAVERCNASLFFRKCDLRFQ